MEKSLENRNFPTKMATVLKFEISKLKAETKAH